MARNHFERFGRPLSLLHCSVIESKHTETNKRKGFGFYGLAPPPATIANSSVKDDEWHGITLRKGSEDKSTVPVIQWYEQADAVAATVPCQVGNSSGDSNTADRLAGLCWLVQHGNDLLNGVERIVVADAADLRALPLTNDNPDLPEGIDIEDFWQPKKNRKPTRLVLQRAGTEVPQAAAKAAALAAEKTADASSAAVDAIESGEAKIPAQVTLNYDLAAKASAGAVKAEFQAIARLQQRFIDRGVVVELIEGGGPIDVMNHLGEHSGMQSIVWRAGCWGEHGLLEAILAGAFPFVSAHLAVEAVGGKFWQLMMAENAVQAACGLQGRGKVTAKQGDLYGNEPAADENSDGRPIRQVRLDCGVAIADDDVPPETT